VTTVAQAARLTPVIWAARRQVVVERNVPYMPGRRDWAHRLDIHRPRSGGPWPVVLYVHGGGFGLLSKDSHWHIATALASHGFWVANINYRLAPRHPYPAALEDAAAALVWTAEHAKARGGDIGRLVLAGESAGANLITALTLAASEPFALPWAQTLRQRGIVIRAVLPACGLLEVSDADRYRRLTPHASPRLLKHIRGVCERYTQGSTPSDVGLGLASPLTLLESNWQLQGALPPFFITCGGSDPILSDSQRLHAALSARGLDTHLKVYPGEGHAFAAMPWRRRAKDHWRDTVNYLKHRLE
jgi:acetyl esterase